MMGLLDGAKNLIGDVVAAMDRALEDTGSGKLTLALAKFYPGGLVAFLDRLRETGHGGAVDSWLKAGALPEERQGVSASAVATCLPDAVTKRLAYDLSIPEGRVATALAEFLPAAVAAQSENGTLKPQPNFSTQIR
ncbi:MULTISPECIES: YidB family protein [unclassified Methylobacterium]|uniref:YidB family protein n=1 Tax=unclassified Methylobacterium TaxID=2615210 RepID=UPI001FB89A39|nr:MULTISPECIES: YidB family protein [unclassified Methylobacterium]MCJ2018432.1 YidB family protein [Methylobacterium sp. E-065]